MESWGMQNGALEPWDFGRPGWVSERAYGFITAPVQDSLSVRSTCVDPEHERCDHRKSRSDGAAEQADTGGTYRYFNEMQAEIKGQHCIYGRAEPGSGKYRPACKAYAD
jgi:hypothetical protein